ncbi:hypothetical protein GCM10010398_41940 [Streptomyces fimbriatus]
MLPRPGQDARGSGHARVRTARSERRADPVVHAVETEGVVGVSGVVEVVHVDSLFTPDGPELRHY